MSNTNNDITTIRHNDCPTRRGFELVNSVLVG